MSQSFEFSKIEENFPATYVTADQIAVKSQLQYLWIVSLNLVIMLIGAALGFVSAARAQQLSFYVTMAGTACFLLLIFLGLDKRWYSARAVAETLKGMTWQYLMDAGEFASKKGGKAKAKYLKAVVGEIAKRDREVLTQINNERNEFDQEISPQMEKFLSLNTSVKKECYLALRLGNQMSWYKKRSKENGIQKRVWYFLVAVLQVGAIFAAKNGMPNLTAFIVAMAGGAFSWLQLKRHQELHRAYAFASEDLRIMEEKFSGQTKAQKISELVLETEKAISREHSIWVFRSGETPIQH